MAYESTVLTDITESEVSKKKTFVVDKLPSWKDLLVGCVVADVGNTKRFCTGNWKSQRPVWDNTRCIKCGICQLFCPEGCISQQQDGYFAANLFYCKGCGICAHECWTQAITMHEEY